LEIFSIFKESVKITFFVGLMMILVDWVNVVTKGKLPQLIKGGLWRQYVGASFLGAAPGCLGAFMSITLYVHGLLTFGAIVGAMIATSGDEAFVMLALFPGKALFLFGLLFLMGIGFAWLVDRIAPRLRITPCESCKLQEFHPKRYSWGHYLREHVGNHIVKKHLWQVLIMTFFALLFIHAGLKYWNLKEFVSQNLVWVLLVSSLVGIIPESGPHLVFVMMYAQGLIPFSVLLTSSFVQDGHGMLPLFSFTVRDSVLIKLFNLIFGLGVGMIIYSVGW
jgi:hypothetical protein